MNMNIEVSQEKKLHKWTHVNAQKSDNRFVYERMLSLNKQIFGLGR